MQRELFVPAGDPNLTVDDYGLVDVRLATPFDATGRHFLVVQPMVDSWYWWSADSNAPRRQAFWFSDRAAGDTWLEKHHVIETELLVRCFKLHA